MPRVCYYCHGSGTKRDGSTPCPVCGGTGEDPNWREKLCAICGQSLEYRIDWAHPPNVHKECREQQQWEREQRQREWREKPCAICGQPLRYNINWAHIPNVHKECREREQRMWQEKSCEICGQPLRYRTDWEHIPNVHKECRERERQKWREKPCVICSQPVRYHIDWEEPPHLCENCLSRKNEVALTLSSDIGPIHFQGDEPLPYLGSTPRDCGYPQAKARYKEKSTLDYFPWPVVHITLFLPDEELASRGLKESRMSFDIDPSTGDYVPGSAHTVYQRIGDEEKHMQIYLEHYKK